VSFRGSADGFFVCPGTASLVCVFRCHCQNVVFFGVDRWFFVLQPSSWSCSHAPAALHIKGAEHWPKRRLENRPGTPGPAHRAQAGKPCPEGCAGREGRRGNAGAELISLLCGGWGGALRWADAPTRAAVSPGLSFVTAQISSLFVELHGALVERSGTQRRPTRARQSSSMKRPFGISSRRSAF